MALNAGVSLSTASPGNGLDRFSNIRSACFSPRGSVFFVKIASWFVVACLSQTLPRPSITEPGISMIATAQGPCCVQQMLRPCAFGGTKLSSTRTTEAVAETQVLGLATRKTPSRLLMASNVRTLVEYYFHSLVRDFLRHRSPPCCSTDVARQEQLQTVSSCRPSSTDMKSCTQP